MYRLINLSNINLNLLLSLKVLLDERNVSSAAAKLNLTQPTMSRNLSHLREYFQDPLLVRSGKAYILTPPAQCLKEKLDMVLDGIGSLFANAFKPSMHTREFVLAAPDYVVQYVLVDVLTFLLSMESNLHFTIRNWDATAKAQLLSGDIHLAISIDNKFPPNMFQRVVDEDSLVVAARAGHPVVERDVFSVEDFVAYPHVAMMTGGGWNEIIDRPLREMGLRRTVKLKIGSYAAALELVKRTDLLTVVPLHVARNSQGDEALRLLPLPLPVPKVQMALWWHECHQNDPAHRWLREELFPKILCHPNQLGLSAPGVAVLAALERQAS
jgi:DNA-binding transcriptional LysR family regulator